MARTWIPGAAEENIDRHEPRDRPDLNFSLLHSLKDKSIAVRVTPYWGIALFRLLLEKDSRSNERDVVPFCTLQYRDHWQ